MMATTITVRGLSPQDKSWLQREARTRNVSMAALVRQIIHESREKSQRQAGLAEAFERHFGPEHGVALPRRVGLGWQDPTLSCTWGRPMQFGA